MSRRRNITYASILLACLCLAFVAGFLVQRLFDRAGTLGNRGDPLVVYWEAWDKVEEHFYGDLPSGQERTYAAIYELLALLDDPYTSFVEPRPRELERDRLKGAFGGIGVTVWRSAEGVLVLSPYVDSPAERAGVQDGDVLLALDGQELGPETTEDDVRVWLHGEVGTTVTLTLSRPPTPPFDLALEREQIRVPSVTWRVLDQAPDIGYVQITSFTERTGEELGEALDALLDQEVEALILDLRNNTGGLIEPAVQVASQFLDDGYVLHEMTRDAGEESYSVRAGGKAIDLPLAVLVNGSTASASEIVAGALQDHGRAPLIGEPTYGKGSVQLIYELSDGSSLHVTSAVWLTPNRHQIEDNGLEPGILIQNTGQSDAQLERALEFLEKHE